MLKLVRILESYLYEQSKMPTSKPNHIAKYTKPSVYYCRGMEFYGKRIKKYFSFNDFNPNMDTLFLGLYFNNDYNNLKKVKGKRYIFWNGSDVRKLLLNPRWVKILKEFDIKHICHNKQLRNELESIGIEADIRPIFFNEIEKYPVSYKQASNPQVYMNTHKGREVEYGVGIILDIAEQFPDITFHIYGIDGKNKKNIIYHGWIGENKMDREIKNYQGCLRLNEHDGLSQIVIKAGLLGQYIITRQKIDGTWKFKKIRDLSKLLKRLKKQKKPNMKFRELVLPSINNFDWL